MRLTIPLLLATFHVVALQVSAAAQDECVIETGEGGRTHTFATRLLPGRDHSWDSVPASDFVRKTTGPCLFTIYNSTNFAGRFVTLGANLTVRIRAGLDGIRFKDEGGGQTWRIRSIKIQRPRQTDCSLRIGGGGVRMDYYASANKVPAMDRVESFLGGNCSAEIWNGEVFGRDDPHKRFKALHPSGPRTVAYDPGFRIRSLAITDFRSSCSEMIQDHGRCLPWHRLPSSIYETSRSDPDRDGDGLSDRFENMLAEAFRPIYVNDSGENATRINVYTTVDGEQVLEPVTIFQAHSANNFEIVIVFMKLWRQDRSPGLGGGTGGRLIPGCASHEGDSQVHTLHLKTMPLGTADHGRFWYVYRTGDGVPIDSDNTDPDFAWQQGDGSLRKVTFESWGTTSQRNHLVIYFSRGKHHEYADGGWSGGIDKRCSTDSAFTNGMGHLHRPPYPKRIAIIRTPVRFPSRFGYEYTNVGSRDVPFFDDLGPLGFPGQRVWSGREFYSSTARPVDRRFK